MENPLVTSIRLQNLIYKNKIFPSTGKEFTVPELISYVFISICHTNTIHYNTLILLHTIQIVCDIILLCTFNVHEVLYLFTERFQSESACRIIFEI